MKQIFISIGLIGLIGLIGNIQEVAVAQTSSEFIVSWRALNYVPSDYQGKTFPSNSTPIEVGFDLIINGKVVNLSRNQIRWNVNGSTIKSGAGIKTVKFLNEGREQTVRITAEYQGVAFDEVFIIPSVKPEIIINTKLPYKNISLGEYAFTALPYFFNISNLNELSFKWTSNNQVVIGEANIPHMLQLNLESEGIPQETKEFELNISVSVQNIFNQLEVVKEIVNLVIK